MSLMITPDFTETDIRILDSFTEDEIRSYIDFFISNRELMWHNDDTGEVITDTRLQEIGTLHNQPRPVYPRELLRLGEKCDSLLDSGYRTLKDAGFFADGLPKSDFPYTMLTPTLICANIAFAYAKDPFCDGLLGFGIGHNIYLKLMLHLQDCHRLLAATRP